MVSIVAKLSGNLSFERYFFNYLRGPWPVVGKKMGVENERRMRGNGQWAQDK
jgi:hypothetical protein